MKKCGVCDAYIRIATAIPRNDKEYILYSRVRVRVCARAIQNKGGEEKLTKMNKKEEKKKGMYPDLKPKQKKVAEALVDPEDERTVTQLCKDFNISRTTFYNWQKEHDFMSYVEFLVESFTTSIIPKAWKQISRKINEGNMEAIRMLLEVKGKLQKDSAVNNNNVVIFTGEGEIPE